MRCWHWREEAPAKLLPRDFCLPLPRVRFNGLAQDRDGVRGLFSEAGETFPLPLVDARGCQDTSPGHGAPTSASR